jgi:DNA modification methylase
MNALQLEHLNVSLLKAYAGNPRRHPVRQIKKLMAAISTYGFLIPLLIDKANNLIAGHGRLLAAIRLNLEQVPVIRIEHLTDAQIRAFRVADNRLAQDSDWDLPQLKIEIDALLQLDFDVAGLTGFETAEIDLLFEAEEAPELPLPALPPAHAIVSRHGDIWQTGPHRVACGDCCDPELLKRLVGEQPVRMVLADLPYNVAINGHVCGKGKHQHAEFAMASGEMSSDKFTIFLVTSIGAMSDPCEDGAVLVLFMSWHHLKELLIACDRLGLTLLNICVWAKTNAGMGSLYRSQHELVLIVKKGKAPHTNNVELGKHGRYRSNVWNYAGMNTFGAERDEALRLHPTVKPLALVADAIKDVTHIGDLVLDGFLGSGTTLLAAEQCRRRCCGVEIEPGYVDVTLKRWMDITREQPVHVATGLTFDQMREQRTSVAPVEV